MVGAYDNTFYVNDGIFSVLIGLVAALLIGAAMVRLALFVVRSASLFKIARRRGLRCAWLAWVPVCNNWVLGSVADQYQYVVKGRVKNRRLPLLLLGAGVTAFGTATSVAGIELLVSNLQAMMRDYGVYALSLFGFVALLILWGSSVAYIVVRCVALYDLYSSCTKKYNVLFLVLGLVFQFLEPVFFFICRNKEEGMPPRRKTATFVEPEFVTEE